MYALKSSRGLFLLVPSSEAFMVTLSAWAEENILGLPCRVLLPEPYEPQSKRYPLVVALHGSAERGTDNVAQLKNGLDVFERSRRKRPAIVVAPQLPKGETFGGLRYGGDTPGQRKLVALVRELSARKSVDAARVYGVGFSMGAIGLWDMLARYPELFTAAVLIAGELDVANAPKLVNFPLWTVVGAVDKPVPPDSTREFARLVEKTGGTAKVTELKDVGHEVWRTAFEHEPIWEWLFAQTAAIAGGR